MMFMPLDVTPSIPGYRFRTPIDATGDVPTVFVMDDPGPTYTVGGDTRQAIISADIPGQVHQLPLDFSSPDAYQIIAYLNSLAEQYAQMPEIREFTVALVNSKVNNDLYGQLTTVTNFVKDRLIFVRDPVYSEYVISPDRLLSMIAAEGRAYGDCDDHVLLLNSMLGSLGFVTRVCGVKLYEQDRFDHVISQVWYQNRWLDIDPCAKIVQQPEYQEKLI